MAAEGPLMHRRRLGSELRRLRDSRTLDEVAEATLISTSKLSRLENGQAVPQPRDIRDLVNYYGLDGPAGERLRRWANSGRGQAWWREFSDALTAGLDTYLDYESGASTIRVYASAIVPGLLQTSDYAMRILRGIPPMKSEEQLRRLVEIRERRKQIFVEPAEASSTRLIMLLDEAVLRRPVGTASEMVAQLEHLGSVSRRRNVELRVVPFAEGVHAGIMGSFTIFQYDEDIDRDVVSIESHTGERFMEQPSDVLAYLRMFDGIGRKSLDFDESRALITDIQSQLPR